MSPYIPIVGMVALATVFVVAAVGLSVKVGPRRRNLTKEDSYECGVDPTPAPVGGGRFSVKYYITAMLFIIFDIEIVFLYPWAVSFDRLGLFAVGAMVTFIATVFVAYFYVLRRGGLEWD
ncbi:MAG: NADH-quinone oxidoreductase subunit A [Propionibacteriaceae bacterium]|nr:NADH-quinone oxidoreductase subunit A [Propionibacteriaceae bacterium]